MVVKIFKHKWERVTAIVSSILFLLILIIAIFINNYWSPILASKVKDVVTTSSDGLYKINFTDAELQVLRGRIVINNITLTPDTAVYNRKKEARLAPNNLVELHIKKIILTNIHPLRLYFRKKLDIGEVILKNPEVNISYQLNHTKDTVIKDNRTLWQKISKSLRSIHVGNIIINDIKFKYQDYSGNKVAISELKEMNITANDLTIDSASQTDRSRLLYCKDVIAELNNYSFKTANGLYNGKVNHLKLSTQKSQLNIEGLNLKPINSDAFFAKSHKDKFTIHLDSLQLNHFDFLSYHKYRILTASSMMLSNGGIQIFGNPKSFKQTTDRVATFPNAGLYKINADMRLDTVRIRHIAVYYTESNAKANQTGTISFNNTSGTFLNITTNQAALQKNNIAKIQLTSYFMNRGKLDLQMNFNLTDADKSFNFKGHLGLMDLRTVNPATMPLTMIKINSGTLKQFDFDIQANSKKAKGKILFLYNDVKVSLLKADTVSDDLKKQSIASIFANIFILKHSNPDVPGGTPRSFFVSYNRTEDVAFFKYIWQTLLSGIKPSVGLDKKTQDATTAMLSQHAINKKNRQIKKQERIQKRAERRADRAQKKLGEAGQ